MARPAVSDLQRSIDELARQVAELDARIAPTGSPLDSYVHGAPDPQTAIDIFAGQWASAFPPPLSLLAAGTAPLFEDETILSVAEQVGGVDGARVLELGPLEGGQTYVLHKLGAAEVVAVEASRRAYLKCLIAKELLGMPRARFLLGDLVAYLESAVARGQRFDLCLASGVLYHLRDPLAALELMCRVSDRLLLWTHYYDEAVMAERPELAARFTAHTPAEHGGLGHVLHRHEYREALAQPGFCGGGAETSAWLSRADILAALDRFGFEVAGRPRDDPGHPHGPTLCLAARRRRPAAPGAEGDG